MKEPIPGAKEGQKPEIDPLSRGSIQGVLMGWGLAA
jgi:hypothetical protein